MKTTQGIDARLSIPMVKHKANPQFIGSLKIIATFYPLARVSISETKDRFLFIHIFLWVNPSGANTGLPLGYLDGSSKNDWTDTTKIYEFEAGIRARILACVGFVLSLILASS